MVNTKPWVWLKWVCAGALAVVLGAGGAIAAPGGPQALCQAAAQRASDMTGVPLRVLLAVSLTESGRKTGGTFAAWPWVLNIAGEGVWFDSRAAAVARAQATLAGGETSFDMGCFQINYRWHGEAFTSLNDMIDPDANALYAAQFLTELYAESGDWTVAAGHYHSRTPHFADRYRKVFKRHLSALGSGPLPAPHMAAVQAAPRRVNQFQLLQSGGAPVSMGSLVPVQPGLGGLFDARAASSLWGG
jgi:hypothetical protein